MHEIYLCHVDIWVKIFAQLSECDFDLFGLSQFLVS